MTTNESQDKVEQRVSNILDSIPLRGSMTEHGHKKAVAAFLSLIAEERLDELDKVEMLTKPLLPNSGSVETNVKAWIKDRRAILAKRKETL